ncbi:MAG TPA: SCO family protein [Polyangiaceae bacterium]|nr:SCO family protein [Polyangiaceae bacterium]
MSSRLLGVAAAAGVVFIAGCRTQSSTASATWFEPRTAPELAGLDVTRRAPFELESERGNVVMLSFGYTSCLELCPDTFATAKRVFGRLGDRASRVVFAYVTVDPERDTPEPFASFMASVDPRFIGVYLSGDRLARVLADYHVSVRKRLPDPERYRDRNLDPSRFYAMDHTSGFWLIDRAGRLRVHFEHAAGDEEILSAVLALSREPS